MRGKPLEYQGNNSAISVDYLYIHLVNATVIILNYINYYNSNLQKLMKCHSMTEQCSSPGKATLLIS